MPMKSWCCESLLRGTQRLSLGLRESLLEKVVGGSLEGQEKRPLHCACDEGYRDGPWEQKMAGLSLQRGSMVLSPGLGLEKRKEPTESIPQVHRRTGSSLEMACHAWGWMRVERWPGACWVPLPSLEAFGCSSSTRETSHTPKSDRTLSAASEGFGRCYPEPDLRRKITLPKERKST